MSPAISRRWPGRPRADSARYKRNSSTLSRIARPAGPVGHRHGHRAVERDHRVAGHPLQQPVQRRDLRPVRVLGAGGPVVDRGDRRLELVLAHPAAARSRASSSAVPSAIERPIPARPVLLGERDQLAVGVRPRRTPGVGAAASARAVRRPRAPRAASRGPSGQPDRLVGEVGAVQLCAGAARVALVEHQVQHVQDGAQRRRLLLRGRQPERHARTP